MARMTHKQTSAEDEAEKQIQSIRNETKTDLKKGGKLNVENVGIVLNNILNENDSIIEDDVENYFFSSSSSSSPSSLSSHSSTLKGDGSSSDENERKTKTTTYGLERNNLLLHHSKEHHTTDRLNTNLVVGQKDPALPRSTMKKAFLDDDEGFSKEMTLLKMNNNTSTINNKIKTTTNNSISNDQTRTITSRTPKDFFFINVLGEGSFSTVYYSKEVDTGDEYAIKVLLKSEIRREGRVRYVLREKDIMALLTYSHGGHPFIIHLYCTFQDNDHFALAYAKHGELLDWLHRLGSFDEEATLFYSSEILCALEFLHKCKVIHRDLKPENILVGADWHIMLSDFGTSKIINYEQIQKESLTQSIVDDSNSISSSPDKTGSGGVRSSFVGTAHYISPEVLKSEDVGTECDYWALGAIIFQMISGQPPFRAVNEYKILKKILGLDFHFPEGFPAIAKQLVSGLLVYKPSERLGSASTGGIEALKRHEFFMNVDWENIYTRKPPELKPYLPASCGEPAFYGDYNPSGNIEPGLNEAALSRLMGLGTFSGSNCEGSTSLKGFMDFESIEEKIFSFIPNKNFFSFREKRNNFLPSIYSIPPITSTSSSCSSFGSTQTTIPGLLPTPEELERRRQCQLERQKREHKYHQFVQNNLILKCGLIDKKKGLFARRRMFLLTEGPHLFYVDPVSMHLKGEVPFSAQMRTEAKNFRTFFVHTPKRTYYLFDPERHAKDWCDAIDLAREQHFSNNNKEQKIN
ncbi:Protein kinase domain-containing protein [Meloidogyne graminicola]|uniref:3-phosphoinositide-dependent protein kinase 1 n=1 Tax=Meloidogyne graminicola TaxID=189291 RepID=A0A8S9ZED3_9BILA|nr:Protein kinase domain-containing protein [Meloidogyne graminicola]